MDFLAASAAFAVEVAIGLAYLAKQATIFSGTAIAFLSSYIFAVIAWPITTLWGVFFVISSPVIYTVAYTLAPLVLILGVAQKLEVFYVFLGSAAFVGIVTGLLLKLWSRLAVGIFRLDQQVEEPTTREVVVATHPTNVPAQSWDRVEDSSSLDDWQWLDTFHVRNTDTKPNIKAKRKAHGLLSQTIMEESSSG